MKVFLTALLLLGGCLEGKTVDIISTFIPNDVPVKFSKAEKKGFEISFFSAKQYENELAGSNPRKADKILVWNCILNPDSKIFKLPKSKLIYVLWEPWQPNSLYYDHFSRVYTWDDSLVDGVKFFKFFYPHLMSIQTDLPLFEEKKFCVMIASNLTKERLNMISFFETTPDGVFDFYGHQFYDSNVYQGPIPGYHSGEQKIAVLKKYRFCICFENTVHLQGYITEKIFGCFAAGCVPVYWGAVNIEKYIPKNCFIDYRDFHSKEELYIYLKTMPEEVYGHYLNNIRSFLKSKKAKYFSPNHFDQTMFHAIVSKKN